MKLWATGNLIPHDVPQWLFPDFQAGFQRGKFVHTVVIRNLMAYLSRTMIVTW